MPIVSRLLAALTCALLCSGDRAASWAADDGKEVDCSPPPQPRPFPKDAPFGALHDVVGPDGVLMISMERNVRRFDYSASRLHEAGVFPTKFPASDGWCDSAEQLSKGCHAQQSEDSHRECAGNVWIHEKPENQKTGSGCTSVEQAIAESHRRALASAQQRERQWTAILEEDAVPVRPERWNKAFRDAWKRVPAETKIVRLSYCMFPNAQYQTSQDIFVDTGEFMLAKWHWAPNNTYSRSGCTGGYLVHKDILPEMLGLFPCCCALDCCLEWDFFNKKANEDHTLTRGMQVVMSMDAWGSTDYARDFVPYDMHQNGVLVQDCREIPSMRDPSNKLGEETNSGGKFSQEAPLRSRKNGTGAVAPLIADLKGDSGSRRGNQFLKSRAQDRHDGIGNPTKDMLPRHSDLPSTDLTQEKELVDGSVEDLQGNSRLSMGSRQLLARPEELSGNRRLDSLHEKTFAGDIDEMPPPKGALAERASERANAPKDPLERGRTEGAREKLVVGDRENNPLAKGELSTGETGARKQTRLEDAFDRGSRDGIRAKELFESREESPQAKTTSTGARLQNAFDIGRRDGIREKELVETREESLPAKKMFAAGAPLKDAFDRGRLDGIRQTENVDDRDVPPQVKDTLAAGARQRAHGLENAFDRGRQDGTRERELVEGDVHTYSDPSGAKITTVAAAPAKSGGLEDAFDRGRRDGLREKELVEHLLQAESTPETEVRKQLQDLEGAFERDRRDGAREKELAEEAVENRAEHTLTAVEILEGKEDPFERGRLDGERAA